ncbi:hypothetical protein MAR_020697 [Mya arenaria]|uniref:Uncharacterized protein n=1 Tax=Mya arenaria TaxID=6604 RepID=A0ABY7E5L2_MYAAR|nr:hypothetical protein MAR_020697 [Mya arenaria]
MSHAGIEVVGSRNVRHRGIEPAKSEYNLPVVLVKKKDLTKSFYWQIDVEEKSRHVTALTTQSGT